MLVFNILSGSGSVDDFGPQPDLEENSIGPGHSHPPFEARSPPSVPPGPPLQIISLQLPLHPHRAQVALKKDLLLPLNETLTLTPPPHDDSPPNDKIKLCDIGMIIY